MKSKQMKQQEANTRNEHWNKLSTPRKLEELHKRTGKRAEQVRKILNKQEQQ